MADRPPRGDPVWPSRRWQSNPHTAYQVARLEPGTLMLWRKRGGSWLWLLEPDGTGVGPEMAALGRFYRDVTWEGTIHEGGMGTASRSTVTAWCLNPWKLPRPGCGSPGISPTLA